MRDGALPFSGILYRMNSYTGTPVNTVWFSIVMAALFGALTFVGAQATNAVFAVAIAALYVAYAIPIVACFVFENDFKPGPFDLGVFVGPLPLFSLAFGVGADIISVEFTRWLRCSGVHGVHDHHFRVPHIPWGKCYFYELHHIGRQKCCCLARQLAHSGFHCSRISTDSRAVGYHHQHSQLIRLRTLIWKMGCRRRRYRRQGSPLCYMLRQ